MSLTLYFSIIAIDHVFFFCESIVKSGKSILPGVQMLSNVQIFTLKTLIFESFHLSFMYEKLFSFFWGGQSQTHLVLFEKRSHAYCYPKKKKFNNLTFIIFIFFL